MELTKLQAEIDEVMLELINLHERYDELEKNAASDKPKKDIDSTQCLWKPQEQTAYKDVVPHGGDRVTSESVVDFSTLYSNHKATSAMIADSSRGLAESLLRPAGLRTKACAKS